MTGGEARRLTLLRHAKAGARDIPDHERQLAPEGRRQCPRVADHLRAAGRLPQLVLCSSSARTRETWDLVAEALPEAAPEVRYLDSLYLGEVADVLAAVAGASSDVVDVLVVGHEPTMSETALWLAGQGSDSGAFALVRVGVPTASLTLLSTDEPWQQLGRSGARLSAVLTSPR
jgi:phosphohistidine phosphatase